jgi:hypothetical protein
MSIHFHLFQKKIDKFRGTGLEREVSVIILRPESYFVNHYYDEKNKRALQYIFEP